MSNIEWKKWDGGDINDGFLSVPALKFHGGGRLSPNGRWIIGWQNNENRCVTACDWQWKGQIGIPWPCNAWITDLGTSAVAGSNLDKLETIFRIYGPDARFAYELKLQALVSAGVLSAGQDLLLIATAMSNHRDGCSLFLFDLSNSNLLDRCEHGVIYSGRNELKEIAQQAFKARSVAEFADPSLEDLE